MSGVGWGDAVYGELLGSVQALLGLGVGRAPCHARGGPAHASLTFAKLSRLSEDSFVHVYCRNLF